MKYAIWNLDITNPENITGPEPKIAELGGHAEGGWVHGQAENGDDILGYVTGQFATDELSAWNYREITQQQALEFALEINPEAYLIEDGRIAAPIEE
jgi:hypothetical protein